jgi:hypothetical protein
MWIRTQDKEKLLKVNSIECKYEDGHSQIMEINRAITQLNYINENGELNEEIEQLKKEKKQIKRGYIIVSKGLTLGMYDTKERCLEIIESITTLIALETKILTMPSE